MTFSFSDDDNLLRQLFSAAPDAQIVTDLDGKILLVNEQTLLTFGYQLEELLGLEVEVLIPERFRQDHPRRRSQYLADPSTRPMGPWRSFNGRHKRGMEIPVEVRLSKLAIPSGSYILAAIRDVSERRWMESMIQGNSMTLEMIATGALLSDVLITIVNLFEQSNPRIRCAVLRRDVHERRVVIEEASSLSEEYRRTITDKFTDPARELASEAVYQGERIVAIDAIGNYSRPEMGNPIRACWSEPVKDSMGETLGAIVALCEEPRDPTPREREQLSFAAHMVGIGMERDCRSRQSLDQQAQLRQKHKLEAVGALAGGIAHEFNNLLQVISAYTDFALTNVPPTASTYQDLTTVRTAAKRATSLTRQLLGFCRRQPLEQQLFFPNRLMSETADLLRPLIGENTQLTVACDEKAPCVLGDVSQLQQVLMNLCINARDAMPEGGQLRISTQTVTPMSNDAAPSHFLTKDHPGVVLTVQDTGIGMSADVRARIFEPFFTTKELGKGTGLGLSMAYGIIAQHGGQIKVDSEPGKGTTFRIFLPAAEGDASKCVEPDSDTDKADHTAASEASTILVVEDDASVRGALERIVRRAGYSVLTAENGDMALKLFEDHPNVPAMAVLDMVMPGLSGRAVAARMRELRPGFPLIFCTGYDPDGTAPLAGALTDVPTVGKPVEAEQLLKVVRSVLDKSHETLPKRVEDTRSATIPPLDCSTKDNP
jgi:PAS domain S-box-containing protein